MVNKSDEDVLSLSLEGHWLFFFFFFNEEQPSYKKEWKLSYAEEWGKRREGKRNMKAEHKKKKFLAWEKIKHLIVRQGVLAFQKSKQHMKKGSILKGNIGILCFKIEIVE